MCASTLAMTPDAGWPGRLEGEELRQFLVKSWMTHDAMWFRYSLETCGIEQTNRVNLAAVRALGAQEIRRLVKALGWRSVDSMAALRQLIETAWGIIGADFMDFSYSFPAPQVMRWEVRRCFAFDGVTRLGVADRYVCGIFPRVEAWFDALAIAYTVAPVFDGCLMFSAGACSREYTFTLPV